MSRDKQISEMMQVIKEEQLKIANDSAEYQKFMANGVNYCHADALYNAGYRKASDIAREIFEGVGELTEENERLKSVEFTCGL